MIRRDWTETDGSRQWLLIDQIKHAGLAGQLAETWRGEAHCSLEPRGEILQAVIHHDDGWALWDSAPGIDANTGMPSNFNEMLLGESLAIWRHSITAAQRWGNLAAYAVAGHFCALLRRFDSWQKSPAKEQLARKFLDYYDRQMGVWLAGWQPHDQTEDPEVIAERGVAWLQFFDALSLWFCCAERTSPESFVAPGGTRVTFTPMNGQRVAVDPWPWPQRDLKLGVSGRKVAATGYADAKALADAPHEPVTLAWRLEPQIRSLGAVNRGH